MTTIIEQAIKGQRKAMEELYASNKQKVYYMSLLLLGNESEAAEATVFAFKNIWSSMLAHDVQTEEDFRHLMLQKTTEYCKRKIIKDNSKAFRIPPYRNFLIVGDNNATEGSEKPSVEFLKLFPPLQRFIYVLHIVGEYLPEQIADIFKLDMKTIGLALDVEQTNIERAVCRLGENKNTYKWVLGMLHDREKQIKIPSSVDERIAAVIDTIATPIEQKKKKQLTIIGIVAAVVCTLVIGIVVLASRVTTTIGEDDTVDAAETLLIDEPVIDLDETMTYYADIEIANYGTITIEMDQESAPVTVANFVNLAQNGFYNGLTFHRIIEDFMMQGGDPNGDGTGGNTDEEGNEINIVGEFTNNGYENSLSHTRGAISMARADAYDSASSQFFIVHEDSDFLDGSYAVFGYVTEGLEVVDAICEAAEPTDGNGTIEAEAQPVITSITIRTVESSEPVDI